MTTRERIRQTLSRTVMAVIVIAALTPAVHAQGADTPAQSQAWAASLAAETAGDIVKARALIVSVYGEQPEAYLPCVRLAWLSLQLNRGREAAALYRRARQLPGALPEATQGLTLALARAGYEELDRGNIPAARRNWQEALRLNAAQPDAEAGLAIVGPSTGASAEAWAGRLTLTTNTSTAGLMYVHVPIRLNDHVSVRGAFRNVMSPSAAAGTTSAFQSQQEFFGGVSVEQGIAAIDVVGLRLHSSSGDTTGGAVNLRAGGHAGVTMMAAGQHTESGWNTQWMPQVFVWVHPTVALAGGVRITDAPTGTSVSGVAGATWISGRLQVDAVAHAGTERSAFTLAGPTILSFSADTTSGGTATVAYRVGSATVFAQCQIEQLSAGAGKYTSVAGGVRFALTSK